MNQAVWLPAVCTSFECKLVILSDVPGLLETDDSGRLTKKVVAVVDRITTKMEKQASARSGSDFSAGGISAKIKAARMATAAGVETWIASGHEGDSLNRILEDTEGAGTRFLARETKYASHDTWIAFGRHTKGHLVLDDGAVRAVVDQRKSLLPAGVKHIRGSFAVGDTVSLKSTSGEEVARGLVNFSAADLKKIRGRHSRDIQEILGRPASGEVIHRDNLVLF